MTVVERLAELRRHLEHLRSLEPRVRSSHDLEDDMSLHNDVLFSLLMVTQLVVDIAAHVSASEGMTFEDYTTAVRNLRKVEGFEPHVVDGLARLPGFRNVLLHEYVELDYDVVVRALAELEPVEEFVRRIADRLEGEQGG